jgi:hypothetical protein
MMRTFLVGDHSCAFEVSETPIAKARATQRKSTDPP